MSTGFDARTYLPRELYEGITDIRVRQPAFADGEADRRSRRRVLVPDGKLVILAADHPGRASLKIQDDLVAMADRHEFLARILRVLSHPGIDGFMSTPDVVEDLLILGGLIRERGGQSPLDDRLLIGCMNRGGLPGSVWDMDDRFTAFTTRRMLVLGMDGGKFMVRIDPTDRGSLTTIEGCVRAIGELAESSLLSFVEPLPVVRDNGTYKVVRTARALTEAVSVASAWGTSSLYTWIKAPTCPEFEKVARATTLPLVLLGGEAVGSPRPVLEDLGRGMAAGANVRGAMIGRNVLYPGGDDPRAIAAAVAAIVHDGAGVDEAMVAMDTERGKEPQLA
jgi:DhnA family fructose-bisphosphate aldolase class Ia